MPADAPDPADATRFLASKTRASIAGRGAAQVWAEVTALAFTRRQPAAVPPSSSPENSSSSNSLV
mgnify:CR=1 FL=1